MAVKPLKIKAMEQDAERIYPHYLNCGRVYIDLPYVKVACDLERGILFSYWSGFASYEEFVNIGERIVEIISKDQITRILFDTRDMEVIDDYSQAFISGDYTRDMIRLGIRYAATILPEDPIARESLMHIEHSVPVGESHNNYFDTVEESLAWLGSRC